jgi:hypothetical protein
MIIMVHEQGGEQHQDEEATHVFQRLHPYILDVQSIFLLKRVLTFL